MPTINDTSSDTSSSPAEQQVSPVEQVDAFLEPNDDNDENTNDDNGSDDDGGMENNKS